MFRLNLKIAWRNLWKNKSYTFINILGLSIGMASCILIFMFIRYQLSFDEGFKNGKRIFRVVTDWRYDAFDDYSAGVPAPFPATARVEFAGLEKVGAIAKRSSIVHVNGNNGKEILKNRETVYYTEPEFFGIFSDIKWLYGKPAEAISAPNTVVLAEAKAIQFFGTAQNAIGKNINLGTKTILTVTGVIQDMPQNSSFPLQIVISYENFGGRNYTNWDAVNSSSECFVLLKEGLKISDLDQSLANFNERHYRDNQVSGNQVNAFQPLEEVHFSKRYDNFGESSIDKKELYGLGIIGLFLMVTACINFINLSTAQAVNRSKEVGVRKVIGGERSQLMVQFLTETLMVTFAALIVACILTELAIPFMANLFKGQVVFSLLGHPAIFVFIGVMVLFVSFLAGFYPAVIISGFDPVLAIKNKVMLNSSIRPTKCILIS